MRGRNLIQLIKLLTLLSRPRGATRKEIAGALQIVDRSVSRCIQTIENLGIPVYDEQVPLEKEKRWHIESAYVQRLPNLDLPKIRLSYPEIISLCMLAGESVVFKDTEIGLHIETALAKLFYFLPEETRKHVSALKRIFICKTMGSKSYAGKEALIRGLTESILDHRACKITYHVFYKDAVENIDIGPLHFYEHNGGLYLFAVKLNENLVRSYAVERIQKIAPLNQGVNYPKNFDPEKTLNSAFGLIHNDTVSVKIHFRKTEARYIREKTWAETQTITENPDGSLTLSMTTSGYRDVKRWVMSFGKEARLLAPKKMKQEIEAELREMLQRE
jgi:predicted DNA-binding transcriptional regulator YafY